MADFPFQTQFQAPQQVDAHYDLDAWFMAGRSVELTEAGRKKFKRGASVFLAKADEWSALQRIINDMPSTDICATFVNRLYDPMEREKAGSLLDARLSGSAHRLAPSPRAPASTTWRARAGK